MNMKKTWIIFGVSAFAVLVALLIGIFWQHIVAAFKKEKMYTASEMVQAIDDSAQDAQNYKKSLDDIISDMFAELEKIKNGDYEPPINDNSADYSNILSDLDTQLENSDNSVVSMLEAKIGFLLELRLNYYYSKLIELEQALMNIENQIEYFEDNEYDTASLILAKAYIEADIADCQTAIANINAQIEAIYAELYALNPDYIPPVYAW
jgi:uncharacterized membrane-anchored protein YhcB (DUF1043 family)